MSSLESVWVRCAVISTRSVTSFLVSCFKVMSVMGGKVWKNLRTVPTSHITVYLGSEGVLAQKYLSENE